MLDLWFIQHILEMLIHLAYDALTSKSKQVTGS